MAADATGSSVPCRRPSSSAGSRNRSAPPPLKGHLMKKQFAISVLLVLAVTTAFGHAGHAHTYMGTATMLRDHSFMMKTTEGTKLTIELSPKTIWLHSDGHVAKKSELL